ncbi:hypothetical protein FKM82_010645 [Ascaphus truei]
MPRTTFCIFDKRVMTSCLSNKFLRNQTRFTLAFKNCTFLGFRPESFLLMQAPISGLKKNSLIMTNNCNIYTYTIYNGRSARSEITVQSCTKFTGL